MFREILSPDEMLKVKMLRDNHISERTRKLYSNLALPSYVHGYSLAIEYLYNWFESKFEPGYFVGGIYVDGKHVLDDYKHFSKNVIVAQNPRARMEPRIDYEFDREFVDFYGAPPELYIRRSHHNDAFFKDHTMDTFLGLTTRALRMDCNFKVRVNTRAQQLDIKNRMELYFRVGATQSEYISVDFHVPKSIILNIALRAGFEVVKGEVVDIIEFLQYLNGHSELTFLFKLRAINQKPEFFVRLNGLYTHIAIRNKLQLDDGERNGKLDFNYHVEMTATLTIPIPHFYILYSAEDITVNIEMKERKDVIALYSFSILDIPKVDEHGWNQAVITDYSADQGETIMDLSSIFNGNNVLSRAIKNDLSLGISPSRYINIKIYTDLDIAKNVPYTIDWKSKIVTFKHPQDKQILHVVIYYDREYINSIESSLGNYNNNRISKKI